MVYKNAAAHAKYQREWAAAHPERYREICRKRDRTMHAKRKAWLDTLKQSSGCVDCRYNEHPVALQFDHVRGEKKFNISAGMRKSIALIQEELEKCEVRCANCHAIRTYERAGHDLVHPIDSSS